MTWNSGHFYTEVLIDGVVYRTTGEPAVTESLDALSTVAEFELIDRPDPVPPAETPVEIRRVNVTAETYIPLFGGYLTSRDVQSEPHRLVLRAVDELDKFNVVRTTNDLNLTGMTDGEAWETIAGVCDVDFDTADIADTGYVLGERADVFWKVDQTAAQIIVELDRVFGCKTMTVLNNRVCRIVYTRTPVTDDIQRTFEKAESNDFWANGITVGNQADIQSIWVVQGVTTPCGDDGECSCQVWARSTADVPIRGKKFQRVPTQPFQSDLIQDENLAREIARRQMRWYNRVPTVVSAEVMTDPNIHPGTVIGLVDPTYGIDIATTRAFTVLTADKRGSVMTLTAVGGSPGSTGTTTSGVDKTCNSTSTDIDWDGDWELPDFSFPPIDFDLEWDGFGDFGWSSFPEDDDDTDPPGDEFDLSSANWTVSPNSFSSQVWSFSPTILEMTSGASGGVYTPNPIPDMVGTSDGPPSFTISGTFELPDSQSSFMLGLTAPGEFANLPKANLDSFNQATYAIRADGAGHSTLFDNQRLRIFADGDSDSILGGTANSINLLSPVDFVWTYDSTTGNFGVVWSQSGTDIPQSAVGNGDNTGDAFRFEIASIADLDDDPTYTGGGVRLSNFVIEITP